MTHAFTTLQQLAAEAVADQPEIEIPDHLVDYVANIVDLRTIADRPALIQQAHLELQQAILSCADQGEFDNNYQQWLQDAATMIDSVDGVLDLISPALDFLMTQQHTDDEWVNYYVGVCTHASEVLTEIRDRCQVFITDFGNYNP